uniref:Uncharacterized protein n=1 Tax=Kalanchoe fedtschenkoi TaxID=63787 RepID=A0A7N0SXP1_KALFE
MGGYTRRKKSSCLSMFNIFKVCFSDDERGYDSYDEALTVRRRYRSDEDRGYWIPEPGINKKASAFIARYHESHACDPESQYA